MSERPTSAPLAHRPGGEPRSDERTVDIRTVGSSICGPNHAAMGLDGVRSPSPLGSIEVVGRL
jgi:hypothetical protein